MINKKCIEFIGFDPASHDPETAEEIVLAEDKKNKKDKKDKKGKSKT